MSEKGQGEESGAGTTTGVEDGVDAGAAAGGGSQADQSGPGYDEASGISVGGEVGTEVESRDVADPGLPEAPETPEVPETQEMPAPAADQIDQDATQIKPPPPDLDDFPGELERAEQEAQAREKAQAEADARQSQRDRAYDEAMQRRYEREMREQGLDPDNPIEPPDLTKPIEPEEKPAGSYTDPDEERPVLS
jgi:hypothetical protein